ncbi:hypothetical protein T492DRAFT_941776 [Pavlovales sp. CCMP2436]|nr:hypothetical protein T492DRAFT_941776 [Pavlovales sp. CCMP2436]
MAVVAETKAVAEGAGDTAAGDCRIYLGGLPFGMEEAVLLAWLRDEHALEPSSATIARKRNGWSKGHASVQFTDGEAAKTAAALLDGTVGPIPTKHIVARVWADGGGGPGAGTPETSPALGPSGAAELSVPAATAAAALEPLDERVPEIR